MSISLPTYTRREMPLQSRRHRVLAIVSSGLRHEFRRPAAILAIAIGTTITTLISIILLLFAFLFPSQPRDLSFFFITASSPAILFFVTLMASVVGSGLIADDLDTMALTLYLSRPITHADYLIAKGAILVPLIAMIAILPLILTPFLAALIFSDTISWATALAAMAISFAVGLLFTVFYASVALFLSSLTRRKAYAAAGVFAVTFGLSIPAGILGQATSNSSLLYLSPWEDYMAVARAAFGASGGSIDWPPALAILLGVTVLAAAVTYVRMKAMEVISG